MTKDEAVKEIIKNTREAQKNFSLIKEKSAELSSRAGEYLTFELSKIFSR